MASSISEKQMPAQKGAKYSEVLEDLWGDYRSPRDDRVVDIDAMIDRATSSKPSNSHQVELDGPQKEALRQAAIRMAIDPWSTEGRRRFILAGMFGEALADRAIELCGKEHGEATMPGDVCSKACEAARKITEEGPRSSVFAAMVLMPEGDYAAVKTEYARDPWMISGYFVVPLEGVDLRAEWDTQFTG